MQFRAGCPVDIALGRDDGDAVLSAFVQFDRSISFTDLVAAGAGREDEG